MSLYVVILCVLFVMAGRVARRSLLWWRERQIGVWNNSSWINGFTSDHVCSVGLWSWSYGWVLLVHFERNCTSHIKSFGKRRISLFIYDSPISDDAFINHLHLAVLTTRLLGDVVFSENFCFEFRYF